MIMFVGLIKPSIWTRKPKKPTVPAPASTLAPFGLEDHQVPDSSWERGLGQG